MQMTVYLQLTAFVDGHVDRILDAYDVEAEPECFVQAYKQRMAGNEHLT